jgi:deoxyribodipyrimidine photo-lyase
MVAPTACWYPSRDAALKKLAAFLPGAGRDYAAQRNHDNGRGRHTSVSCLSPWLRHRSIGEWEVVLEVLRVHSPTAADKFIQEVCWRTYWKGWLEMRPTVWQNYLSEVGNCYRDAEVMQRMRGATN